VDPTSLIFLVDQLLTAAIKLQEVFGNAPNLTHNEYEGMNQLKNKPLILREVNSTKDITLVLVAKEIHTPAAPATAVDNKIIEEQNN
jgi:hypothetical protein